MLETVFCKPMQDDNEDGHVLPTNKKIIYCYFISEIPFCKTGIKLFYYYSLYYIAVVSRPW